MDVYVRDLLDLQDISIILSLFLLLHVNITDVCNSATLYFIGFYISFFLLKMKPNKVCYSFTICFNLLKNSYRTFLV